MFSASSFLFGTKNNVQIGNLDFFLFVAKQSRVAILYYNVKKAVGNSQMFRHIPDVWLFGCTLIQTAVSDL